MVSSVAILGQATACPVSRCVLFSPCADGRAPCGGAPCAPAAPCQLQAALPGLGVAARDLLRSNVLPGKVAKRLQLLDAAYSVCRHITLAYSNALYDEVNACWRKHDHSEPQSRDHNHMQKIEKIVEFPKMDPADIPLLGTYSTPAPVVDPGLVFHATPAPVIEYLVPVPADIYSVLRL